MGVERRDAARRIVEWANKHSWPVFCGNGYLTRDIAANADDSFVFYLFGGMGLAAAVGTGFGRVSTCDGVVVIEGDGNFLMGVGGAVGRGQLDRPFLHCVLYNGEYQSSGGQSLPADMFEEVDWVCSAFGYRAGVIVKEPDELEGHLDRCSWLGGPSLIVVEQHTKGEVPERPCLTPATMAERFREWAGSV